ncbi:transposase zinc-binding domain-containing protein [Nitrosomonas sp. Nm33]|uniref:transposase zinc-binding domain-containing protein n=1 Tax=Nitrosomonas sp. Nm33 TaxID=133724 RepID=UPI00089CD879|nr:Transposase zinc-binding domain-containing protein [Nitrosomonas sp. Nm33]
MSTAAHRNPQENLHASAHHTDAGKRIHYERHRPEETTLYQLVQEHIETFFAQVETETGSGLPDFVKDEFDAFLECGILAHGFLRLRCADCSHEKLVAFSCKRRGFCPSYGGRRMAQTAASPGRSCHSQCTHAAMGAFIADSAASSIRGPSTTTLAGIASHFARHFHFSDQTGRIQAT